MTRIQGLGPPHASGDKVRVHGAVDDRRALAPQLQGQRSQVFRGRPDDFAAGDRSPREEDVVKRQGRQVCSFLGTT